MLVGSLVTFVLFKNSSRWQPYFIAVAIILLIIAPFVFFSYDEWGIAMGMASFAMSAIGSHLIKNTKFLQFVVRTQ